MKNEQQISSFEREMTILFATVCHENKGNLGSMKLCEGCKKHRDGYVRMFSQALSHQKAELRESIEDLPAFTPVDRGLCTKVADDAKKPRFGTSYLERETVLSLLSEPQI